MTTIEVLQAARAKIAEPEHWTQEAFARLAIDEETTLLVGREVSPTRAGAVCWCATGAIAAIQANGFPVWDNGLMDAFGMTDYEIEDFNDSHTHAEVLALFDQAIAKLESEQP